MYESSSRSPEKGNFHILLVSLLLLGIACALTGCSSLASVKHVVAYGDKQEGLLQERLVKFTKALYWGSLVEASGYVRRGARSKFYDDAREKQETEKLVDIKVGNVDFIDDSSSAEVELRIRYYKKPTYLVKSRTEKQVWKYHRFSGGWFLHEREEICKPEVAAEPRRHSGGRASFTHGN